MVDSKVNLDTLLGKKDVQAALAKTSFEDGMSVLEELVGRVESGSLTLAQAIDSYELASLLVEHLRSALSQAEAKLKILQENSKGRIVAKEC